MLFLCLTWPQQTNSSALLWPGCPQAITSGAIPQNWGHPGKGTGIPSSEVTPFPTEPEGQSNSFLTPSSLLTSLPQAASFHPALLTHFCSCLVESFLLCGWSGPCQLLLPGVGGEQRLLHPTGMRWRVGCAWETCKNCAVSIIRDVLCHAVISICDFLTPGPLGSVHTVLGLYQRPSA